MSAEARSICPPPRATRPTHGPVGPARMNSSARGSMRESIARRACEKAAHDAEPVDLEPGDYTVILEPVAVAELAFWLLSAMDARAADEGRSFYSRAGRRRAARRKTLRRKAHDPHRPCRSAGAGRRRRLRRRAASRPRLHRQRRRCHALPIALLGAEDRRRSRPVRAQLHRSTAATPRSTT